MTTTRYTTAASLHAAILAAAANAPGSTKSKTEVASYYDRAERAAWFFSDGMTATQNEAMQSHVEAWHHTISTEQEHAEGELTEADESTAAPRHVTFRHATGSIKLRNTRERLAGFAADMLKNWALWGGGTKPAAIKKASATSWPALLVKVFAEQMETGAHVDALNLALCKLGGTAYDVGYGAFLAVAPQPVENMPSRLASVYTCASGWLVIDTVTVWGIGNKAGTGKHNSRSAAEKAAAHRWFALSEATRESMANKTEKCDTEQALVEWKAERGIEDAQAQEPQNTQKTAAEQVADVVAHAVATVAIEAAQESATAAELASVATTTPAEADTVAEAVNTDAQAEADAVAELCTAGEAEAEASTPRAEHGSQQAHTSHTTTGHATPAQRTEHQGSAGGQRIAGKSGRWVATFHTTAAGLPGMTYTGRTGNPVHLEFASGSDRMRTLQAMARQDDAPPPQATPAQGFDPSEYDPFLMTVADVQRMPEQQRERVADYWEDINHHTRCLAMRCLTDGREDLAEVCRRIEADNMQAGRLTEGARLARYAVDEWLNGSTATLQTIAIELAHFAPGAADAAAALVLSAGPHTPHPMGAPDTNPQGVCHQQGTDYTDPLKTLKPDYTDPLKTLPTPCDLETLSPADLVGVVAVYTGDACNAPGRGAVVAVNPKAGTVDVMLEDGRHNRGMWLNGFGHKPGQRYGLKPLRHGAPYLAALAAAVATKAAQDSAAQQVAANAKAAEKTRLAVEFAHLQRAENTHQGGVFTARNIRAELKRAFSGVKFSVKSDYSSVRIDWTDGPTEKQVQEIVGKFDIGQSDEHTDYHGTKDTAFSELFGGVEYLFIHRATSDDFTAQALAEWWPTRGESATRQAPTVQDYRKGEGVFSWRDGDEYAARSFRDHLKNIAGPTPTKTTRQAKA